MGLEMAGMNTVCANELTPYACESLRQNKILARMTPSEVDKFIEKASQQRCFSQSFQVAKDFFQRLKEPDKEHFLQDAEIIEGDIRSVSSDVFLNVLAGRKLFAIAGGPPCQPFSKAGKQKSLDCTKNGDLFFEFVRLVSDLKPDWFIFENVKGITFTKTDVLYVKCKKCKHEELALFKLRQDWKENQTLGAKCKKCGSEETSFDVKNEPGGSLKIILNEFESCGYACSHSVLNAADYGAPQIRERLIIVGNIDGKKMIWPTPTHSGPNQKRNKPSLFQEDLKPWKTMREALSTKGDARFSVNQKDAVLWVKNVVRPHDEPVTWTLDRPSPTIGAHQGAKLAIAPFGVPEEQLFRQQWHSKGRRQGDTPPVKVVHDYLSDEELLILQTFPRWWYLHGTRMERAFQIGNAVPPLLGYVIGKAILYSDAN